MILGSVAPRAITILLVVLLPVPVAVYAQEHAPDLRTLESAEVWSSNDLELVGDPAHGSFRLRSVSAMDALSDVGAQQSEPSVRRHVLIGAGVGLAAGLVFGWSLDSGGGPADSADSFWNFESKYYYRIMGSLIGGGAGGATGATVYLLRRGS